MVLRAAWTVLGVRWSVPANQSLPRLLYIRFHWGYMVSGSNSIVFTHGGGRFGNQFLNAANLIALDREFDSLDVIDLALIPYSEHYQNDNMPLISVDNASMENIWKTLFNGLWSVNPKKRAIFVRWDKIRCRTVHSLADHAPNAQSVCAGHTNYAVPGEMFESLRLNDAAETVFNRQPLTVLSGWRGRCWPLVKTHETAVREALTIGTPHRERAREFIQSLRDDYDCLVGVLLRQGDYRSWHDGDYYFETSRYEQWLDSHERSHSNERIGYVIASDEPQHGHFEATNRHTATGKEIGTGHYLESLVELSLCDVILTPPSTFSTCAAFLGETPVVPLHDENPTDSWVKLDGHLFDCLEHPHMSESVK